MRPAEYIVELGLFFKQLHADNFVLGTNSPNPEESADKFYFNTAGVNKMVRYIKECKVKMDPEAQKALVAQWKKDIEEGE